MAVSVYERMARFGAHIITSSVQKRVRRLLWSFVQEGSYPGIDP